MGATTAGQVFKDFEKGVVKPFYFIVGEEPFQATEILERAKKFFVPDPESADFSYESFEGEGIDGNKLLASLEMMPGLFADESAKRFIVCQRFDKVAASQMEILEPYFANPSPTTVFLMTGAKMDKRKSWTKKVMEKGDVVEVSEPYDRDWPKWQGYFEKKVEKRIDPEAWTLLVEASNRTLSLLWPEVQKAALYVGTNPTITLKDVEKLVSGGGIADIFAFAEDVVAKRKYPAMKKYQDLLRNGESEIKILSLVVRQFRMVEQCLRLTSKGITDSKVIAGKIGAHPFFVSKIIQQTKGRTLQGLGKSLSKLADVDYRMKRGDGDLFTLFLSNP